MGNWQRHLTSKYLMSFQMIPMSSQQNQMSMIYEALMRRLRTVEPDVAPNQVFFIDDKTRNTTAAIDFGLKAIHFDSRKHSIEKVLKPAIIEHGVTID